LVKIITPVVSVFDKDLKIDYAGTAQVIKFLLQNQVDGILVLGSTGEFPNLDLAAKKEYFQFYRQHDLTLLRRHLGFVNPLVTPAPFHVRVQGDP